MEFEITLQPLPEVVLELTTLLEFEVTLQPLTEVVLELPAS